MMNKPKEIDYKSLYERQVKALKILNERLRNKEKKLKRLHIEMAHLRQEIRDNNKQELKQRIDKAIDVIHTQMKNNPTYKENLKIIENNLIKGSCKVCDLKDSDVDE